MNMAQKNPARPARLEEEEGFLQEAARIRTFQESNPGFGDSESLNALTSTEVLGALCIGSEWA